MAVPASEGVDIIIPYHGQYALLKRCIISLIRATPGGTVRITIVDDFSKNDNFFKEVVKLPYVSGIQLPEQKGFAAAVNAGVKATKKPYICLLNSDCMIVETRWLIELYKCYQNKFKEGVRLVSAVTDNLPIGNSKQRCNRYVRERESEIVKEPCSLFCSFMHRKLFEKIGPLVEYPFGYYEDEELFYRMRKFKMSQAVCPKAWVQHEGGSTVKYLWETRPETEKIMKQDNRQKCIDDLKKLLSKK